MTELALSLDQISKRFGLAQALSDVSLAVRPGTVHALLGENGAGKTTLMRVAYGLVHPDHGTVRVGGAALRLRSPADAIRAGISMVQQHFALVPAMTVVENIALGYAGPFRPRQLRDTVRSLAAATGLSIDPDARISTLNVASRQRVEIIKSLIRSTRVLILDEPTSVLSPSESTELLRWLRSLAAEGRSVVLITHKLDEALSVADDITVLRNGRGVLSGTSGVTANELVQAMLGESVQPERIARHSRAEAQVIARARALTVHDDSGVERLRQATIEVLAGQITGVAGVEGSGHLELLRALAGRVHAYHGSLELPASIAYMPDDRLRDALIPEFDLTANFALRNAGIRRGLMRWRSLATQVTRLLSEFDVRSGAANTRIGTLSGGNQQKFVFLRELSGRPSLLIAVNPTRGLDVKAAQSLHARLRQASDDGLAVVMYSSDLDELIAVADRMYVVHAGMLVEVPVDREIAGRAMISSR